jgi:[ribosomal protein S18]-alanine N-acetyltransferase
VPPRPVNPGSSSVPLLFIGAAEMGDVDVLLALERASAHHPWTAPHFVAAMDPSLGTETLVVRALAPGTRTTRVVAFCAIRLVVDEVHVENLAVDPGLRRQGIGSRLLDVALGAAARKGAGTALLEVRESNTAARSLYARAGFRPLGVRREYYREPTEDALLLARTL